MAASSIVVETAAAEAEPPAVSSLVTKEAGSSSSGGIGATEDEVSGSSSGGIGITKAFLDKYLLKTGVGAAPDVKAWLYKYAAGELKPRRTAETVVTPVMKERVPDAYIETIKRHPLRKTRPLKDSIARGNPRSRQFLLDTNADIDYMVDLQQDCLRQHAEKGYAEVGVDYTDGFKKSFILPHQPK